MIDRQFQPSSIDWKTLLFELSDAGCESWLHSNLIWLDLEQLEYWHKQNQGPYASHRPPRSFQAADELDPLNFGENFPWSQFVESIDKENWIEWDQTFYLFKPIFNQGHLIGAVLVKELNEKAHIVQLSEFLSENEHYMYYAADFETQRQIGLQDDLTCLGNQRAMYQCLDRKISKYKKHHQGFCVMFMDLDHFKLVNDNCGHLVGSKVLVQVGELIKQQIRPTDHGFRYGGDEFVVILNDLTMSECQSVAERIRDLVEKQTFALDGQTVSVTVSIGVARFPEHASTREQIVQMADQAMYYGKVKSRNIVYIAS